jgi:hypothetical protein
LSDLGVTINGTTQASVEDDTDTSEQQEQQQQQQHYDKKAIFFNEFNRKVKPEINK